jgi:hypothetical protein
MENNNYTIFCAQNEFPSGTNLHRLVAVVVFIPVKWNAKKIRNAVSNTINNTQQVIAKSIIKNRYTLNANGIGL